MDPLRVHGRQVKNHWLKPTHIYLFANVGNFLVSLAETKWFTKIVNRVIWNISNGSMSMISFCHMFVVFAWLGCGAKFQTNWNGSLYFCAMSCCLQQRRRRCSDPYVVFVGWMGGRFGGDGQSTSSHASHEAQTSVVQASNYSQSETWQRCSDGYCQISSRFNAITFSSSAALSDICCSSSELNPSFVFFVSMLLNI